MFNIANIKDCHWTQSSPSSSNSLFHILMSFCHFFLILPSCFSMRFPHWSSVCIPCILYVHVPNS